jgi:peroxiredoxin
MCRAAARPLSDAPPVSRYHPHVPQQRRWTFRLQGLLLALVAALACAKQGTAPAVGSAAPDFTAYSFVSGTRMRLSDQRGKVVVLTFWATWCSPCREELPNLEGIQEHVGKDQLVVLAVSFRDGDETLRYLKKSAKQAGWQLSMLQDPNGSIAERYAVSTIPHLVVIARDGRIAAVHSGFGDGSIDELLPELTALLAGKPLPTRDPPPVAQ